MKRAILIFLLCMCFTQVTACAQPACLVYFDSVPTFHAGQRWQRGNPDSVLVDSCESSSTYGEHFITHWIEVTFTYNILPIPVAPADTDIEVTWQAINTNYSTVRAAFSALATKYGPYTFKKIYPAESDTGNSLNNVFYIRFSSYVCADSVTHDLSVIPLLSELDLLQGLLVPLTGAVDVSNDTLLRALAPYPNPTRGILHLSQYPLHNAELLTEAGNFLKFWKITPDVIDLRQFPSGHYFLTSNETKFEIVIEK